MSRSSGYMQGWLTACVYFATANAGAPWWASILAALGASILLGFIFAGAADLLAWRPKGRRP